MRNFGRFRSTHFVPLYSGCSEYDNLTAQLKPISDSRRLALIQRAPQAKYVCDGIESGLRQIAHENSLHNFWG